ncbi:MAG: flagellar protein FliS [Clostridiales bacterium]|jgi:flagellar protein FliS|nr:flagellar protein FliS [Clostridiales bacterium]
MSFNPIMQYKQQSVSTMSRGEQLVALFDEALKNIRYGAVLLKGKNWDAALKCTEKSRNIFSYLSSVLDGKYRISADLYQMYYFFNQEIIRAEVRRDPAALEELLPLVEDLRNTWAQADKQNHTVK